jgi:Spy/CpxP family protein refolding chaperone
MEGFMKNLLMFLIMLTSVAMAQPRKMGDGRPMRGIPVIEKLNLSDDQRKQVDKLHSDLQKKQIALRAKIQSARVDVRDAFREDKPDRAKIEAKLSEITKAQGEMKNNQVAFWFDVNKILTPDQQKIWKQAAMMHRRAGEGMRGGHRPLHHKRMMDHHLDLDDE